MTSSSLSAPPRLTAASPAAAEAVRRRQGARIGAVHFGPGAFHRAHQAFYFDRLMAADPRFGICEVSLKTPGVRDALEPQDGLYVLAQLEREKSLQVIGSILELLVAPEDPEAVLARLASPEVVWISATVTEKGYCLNAAGELDLSHPDIAHDLQTPQRPVSLIGYIAEGLARRRAAGAPPVAVVSCDNLPGNSHLLKRAIIAFAGRSDPDLAAWIEARVAFPRTMVDSITPATDQALRDLVADELGVVDAWPVQRERFVQWVVEDCLPAGAPDLASVGVELTADVAGYETVKLRLLNAAHSALAYMGLNAGHQTVAQAMADPGLADFTRRLMIEDIAPLVRPPAGLDLDAYIAAILSRFANPAIRHALAQIGEDGSKKLPIRFWDTLNGALAANRPIERLARPLAAWMIHIIRQARAGERIVDPLAIRLQEIGLACTGDAPADVGRFLALEAVFSPELAADPRLRSVLGAAYARF
ncbi:MAG: Mannitol dehydrogenase domain [Caulobacteraceae bacterium]|nr:Mannitol dehydrogenase domain [Caulobacteraceae bacterium]